MFRRLLSTTVPRLATEVPVAPSATSLGFKARSRERNFDNAALGLHVPQMNKIPNSIYNQEKYRTADGETSRSQSNRPRRSQAGSSGPPRERNDRPRSPRNDGPRPPRNTDTNTNTNEPSSTEFFAAAEDFGPVEPKAKKRNNSAARGEVDMSTPVVNVNAKRTRNDRGVKSKPKTARQPRRAAPVTTVDRQVDTTFAGLFGRTSLLMPVRRGARDLRNTLGAEGLQDAEARRQEVHRLAGDYSLFTSPSATSNKAADAARALALRVLSQNAQVSLRSRREAKGVLESLIG